MENLLKFYEKEKNKGNYLLCMTLISNNEELKSKIDELENLIIELDDEVLAFYFAKNIKLKDYSNIEQIILKSKSANVACAYAKLNPKTPSLKQIEAIILEYGDAFDSASFATNFECAELKKHYDKIVNSKEAYACYLYCKHFQPHGLSLHRMQRVVIDSKDSDFATQFATDVNNSNLYELAKVVVNYGTVEEATKVARAINYRKLAVISNVFNGYEQGKALPLILNMIIREVSDAEELIRAFVYKHADLDELVDYINNSGDEQVEAMMERIINSDREDLKLNISLIANQLYLRKISNSIAKNRKQKIVYNVKEPINLSDTETLEK